MSVIKLAYLICTGLLTFIYVFGLYTNLFHYEEINSVFLSLGFPTYLIHPLAIAEVLGIIALWQRRYPIVTEWAYCGFFFNLTIAISAHLNAGDNQYHIAVIALIFLITSYVTRRRMNKEENISNSSIYL